MKKKEKEDGKVLEIGRVGVIERKKGTESK